MDTQLIYNKAERIRDVLRYVSLFKNSLIVIHIDEDIQNDKVEKYKIAINELIEGKPLQYITHSQGFMGLNFYVDENVLLNILKGDNK